MRAILIDPYERTITEVQSDGSLTSMHDFVGSDIVASLRLAKDEICWVDDEGYLRAGIPTFQLAGYPHPNAGKGLILGIRPDGENVASKLILSQVRERISFPDLETTGEMEPSIPIEGPFQRQKGDMVFDGGLLGGGPILRQRRNG